MQLSRFVGCQDLDNSLSRGLDYMLTVGGASVAFPVTRCLMDEQGGLDGKSLINFWRAPALTPLF